MSDTERTETTRPWRPSRDLQALLDAREMQANRNYAAEFFRASGAAEDAPIDWPGFAVWLRDQRTEAADRMAQVIEHDQRAIGVAGG